VELGADVGLALVGSHEFALLLPGTDREDYDALGMRLRSLLKEVGAGFHSTGLSIGAAHAPEDGDEARALPLGGFTHVRGEGQQPRVVNAGSRRRLPQAATSGREALRDGSTSTATSMTA
jgi:hypothetical protein